MADTTTDMTDDDLRTQLGKLEKRPQDKITDAELERMAELRLELLGRAAAPGTTPADWDLDTATNPADLTTDELADQLAALESTEVLDDDAVARWQELRTEAGRRQDRRDASTLDVAAAYAERQPEQDGHRERALADVDRQRRDLEAARGRREGKDKGKRG